MEDQGVTIADVESALLGEDQEGVSSDEVDEKGRPATDATNPDEVSATSAEAHAIDEAEQEDEVESEDELEAVDGQEANAEQESKKESRAQTRIRSLNSANKKLQEDFVTTQRQYQAQAENLQQEMRRMQANFQSQLEWLVKQQQPVAKQPTQGDDDIDLSKWDTLTPTEQFEQKLKRDYSRQLKAQLQEHLSPLQQQLAAREAQDKQREAAYQSKERLNFFVGKTEEAARNIVFKDFDPASVTDLADETHELILTYAAGYGFEPSEAAAKFNAYLDRYHKARLKKNLRKPQAVVNKPKALAAGPTPSGKRRVTPSGIPSLSKQEWNAAGFDNALDWMQQGKPQIKLSKSA